ncbi:MAG: Gfo/Idh/MocA family protein [Hyphomonadaceae bacterium]
MSQLKAGVIGAGAFGGHHARNYAQDRRVTLMGVFDPDRARAEALAKQHGVKAFESAEALIETVDLLTIASPPSTHAALAHAALENGRHVLVEKPLAILPEEGERLVRLAKENDLVLAVGHQERLVLEAIGLLDTPERPHEIHAERTGPWTGRSADVSVTLDLMIHDLDIAAYLINQAPVSAEAQGRQTQGALCDELRAVAHFEKGAVAHFHASRISENRARKMTLHYLSGVVTVDFNEKTFVNDSPFVLRSDFMKRPDAQDPLGFNVRAFIAAIMGDELRPPVTGEEGLAALRLAHLFDAQFAKAA